MNNTKEYTISLRVDESFINKLKKINLDYNIGSCCSSFSSSINKSYIIEKAVNLLYLLDLSDKNTFLEVFGFCYGDNYKRCCNTKQEYIIKKKDM